jgi:hypothetical protein
MSGFVSAKIPFGGKSGVIGGAFVPEEEPAPPPHPGKISNKTMQITLAVNVSMAPPRH